MKHFLLQPVSWCIVVKKNLRARGIQGDTICARCGAPEESINHVFFECPPVVQVWALSRVLSNPYIFPTQSLLRIWIIYFGGFLRSWRTINLHGSYGTYRNEETTKFLVIWTLILEILLNWQKQGLYFALRRRSHLHGESSKLDN